ncbi:hypothetical protein D6D01_04358 [Aureobasidium pullulans]|uniref:Uncharacterized protein n=1 Tax=Aureobasidium pullulans TaxID=5580 RepID=A0A4S9LBN7_AURPU|nr:hypothetical protein D6D01_04358 [Aureobasidium pullulans]
MPSGESRGFQSHPLVSSQGLVEIINPSMKFLLIHHPCSPYKPLKRGRQDGVCVPAPQMPQPSLSLPLVISDQHLGLRRAISRKSQGHNGRKRMAREDEVLLLRMSTIIVSTRRRRMCACLNLSQTLPNRAQADVDPRDTEFHWLKVSEHYSVPCLIRRVQQSLHPLLHVKEALPPPIMTTLYRQNS